MEEISFQWEIDEVVNLVNCCNNITFNPDKLETINYCLTSEGVYSIKAFLEIAYKASFIRALPLEIIDSIWKRRDHPRTQLTLWFLARKRLMIGDLLVSLSLIPQSDSLCPWCGSIAKYENLLFFTCPII